MVMAIFLKWISCIDENDQSVGDDIDCSQESMSE